MRGIQTSGKTELARVNEIIQQLELPEFTESCIGMLALTIMAMAKASPQAEAYRLQLLASMIAGRMK
jgi:hypothetical protein